jgi:erythromycin esterase-like protein
MVEAQAGLSELRPAAAPLEGGKEDYDALLERIGDARFVLLGEASHGTHEFYRERARITRRLVEDKGFDAVAAEADWPDAYRVHRYVRAHGADADAEQALRGFSRFPTWMWRNKEVEAFVAWVRAQNDARAPRARVGFYGLDLYSLYASIDAVLGYLDRVDPEAASRARARYGCFEHFGKDTTAYAYAAGLDLDRSCEAAAVQQLAEMRARALEHARSDGGTIGEELFFVEQNALLVKNAEEYYRSMFRGSTVTWNLRDRHMADTLAAIAQHLDHLLGRPCKIVVWAHNSHLGDARATEMGWSGELNLGQLVRERYARDAFLVGFSTYDGTVTAASDWEAPAERKNVRPALAGSHEALFHDLSLALGAPSLLLLPDEERRLPATLRKERLERAIGVVYRPQTERASHWFRARLADQFDAVIHIDRTHAVEPLERVPSWQHGPDMPETFPFAL